MKKFWMLCAHSCWVLCEDYNQTVPSLSAWGSFVCLDFAESPVKTTIWLCLHCPHKKVLDTWISTESRVKTIIWLCLHCPHKKSFGYLDIHRAPSEDYNQTVLSLSAWTGSFWLHTCVFTLNAPNKIAAGNLLNCYCNMLKKIRLDISCESSARQTIHMKRQALF